MLDAKRHEEIFTKHLRPDFSWNYNVFGGRNVLKCHQFHKKAIGYEKIFVFSC